MHQEEKDTGVFDARSYRNDCLTIHPLGLAIELVIGEAFELFLRHV